MDDVLARRYLYDAVFHEMAQRFVLLLDRVPEQDIHDALEIAKLIRADRQRRKAVEEHP